MIVDPDMNERQRKRSSDAQFLYESFDLPKRST